ncbi:MAG: hypothetical protein ABR880_19735 [Candidatus Sulfotelmatobacter sp.]|jgi:hypothetical protein
MRREAERTWPIVIALWLIGMLTGVGGISFAAGTPPADALDAASCSTLLRAAVANEVAAAKDDTTKHMFRSRKQTAQGSQTRLYAETQQAMVGTTVAYNDKPLTPEQKKDEENRLMEMANNPDLLRHKHSQEQENAERTVRIVKALPEAFLYDYDGEEEGSAGLGQLGVRLVRLKFRPNPAYQPPSRVEQVLAGMKGVVVIDPVARRIAKIDGALFKEVGFGWGILGHLDKGGHFLVQQCDAGHDSWEVSRMSLEFTGKILLFKSLSLKSDEVFDNFQRVPADTTFAQGVQLVKAEEAKLAQNRTAGTVETESRSH